MGTYDWMELQTLTNDIAAARARLAAARATKDIGKARGLEEEIARAEAQRDRLLAHITTNLVTAPELAPKGREKDEPTAKGREKDAKPATDATIEPMAPVAEIEAAAAAPADTSAAAVIESSAAPESEISAADGVATPKDGAAPEEDATPAEAAPPEALETPAPEPASVEQPSPEPAVATGAAPPAPAPQAARAEGIENMSWDQLKPSDIERAKEDLVTRRAEMLARHAEELRGLEADQAELDGLEQAITAFLQKFNSPAGAGVVKLDAERELRQTAG